MRACIIPVARLDSAKTRLASALSPYDRRELALAMFADVLQAARDSSAFDRVCVLTSDDDVAELARESGCEVIAERPEAAGLNASLGMAIEGIRVDEVIILHADLPLARADDIAAVVAALPAGTPAAALVRSRDGGTNLLALRPPAALPLRFGRLSADAHADAARAAGVTLVEVPNERLAFDVDSEDDLRQLGGLRTGAATRGWLDARTAALRRGGA